ncbi:MAG: ABC transporter substrate-binding protein, partial [Dehalococcoidia bacterium]
TAPAASTAAAQATQAAAAPQLTDATLTSAIASDIGSGDPQSLGGTGGGNWPNTDVHFGGAYLQGIDEETRALLPNVAESVEEAPDHMSFVYRLRPDVKFHNGETVTAEDVKFSMDRGALGTAAYNPEFKGGHSAQFQGRVKNAEVIDDRTVKFNMEKPDVIFLRRGLFLVPQKHIETVGDVAYAESPVAAGFFKFVKRVPDSEIVSERFDDYFGTLESPAPSGVHLPYIKQLVQKVIPDSQARLAALQAGEVDLIHNVSSDLARQLESDPKFKVYYLPGTQPMHIHINTALENDPDTGMPNPWRDVRVRQAANLAIDLDGIIAGVLTGKEQPSYGSASTGFGFPTDLAQQRWSHDPKQAKELLAAAGYADGFDAKMYGPIGRWPNSRTVMEVIGQSLTEVGIRTTLQELQYQEVTTRFKDDSLGPLVFWGMSGGDDPGANFRFGYHSAGNYTMSVPDPSVDTMIEQSESEFDPEKRADLLRQIVTKFYLDAQWIFLYEPVTVVVASTKWDWDLHSRTLANPEYWNIRPAQA